ncbi:MAG: trigger factor [Gammaproteobacteria bacterium]|nr:trigger factor [Gammaproteobacteria bacterium]
MQVTLESSAGLARQLRVEIPEDAVSVEVDRRLHQVARDVRLPGFRPGKVPRKVVAKRYGPQIRLEVVEEMVRSSLAEALAQEQLRPAAPPRIDPLEADPGQGIRYTVSFDVYPDIEVPDPAGLHVMRPVAEVQDSDVDRMIDTLRQQRRTWSQVERAAHSGDRVNVDFVGRVDGEVLEKASATGFETEIGSGRMIPGFESGLEGLQAGDEKTLELSFPADYPAEDLAGKPVSFEIKVNSVSEATLPEVDEEFARAFGVTEGGLEGLRTEVRANMQRELESGLRARTKERVFEALTGSCEVELPPSMIEHEAERLKQERNQELARYGIQPPEDADMSAFEQQATDRVRLGLLIGALIEQNGIRVDPAEVRKRIDSIASTYQDPDEVVRWYYGDDSRLSQVESAVLEDQVVDWLTERAQVTDEPSSFDRIMNPGQTNSSA